MEERINNMNIELLGVKEEINSKSSELSDSKKACGNLQLEISKNL